MAPNSCLHCALLFSTNTFLFVRFAPLQNLLANACPCGSATSFYFAFGFIELRKYVLIEVAGNMYYYYYYYHALKALGSI